MKQPLSRLKTLLMIILCALSLTHTTYSTNINDVSQALTGLSDKLKVLQSNLTTLQTSLATLKDTIPNKVLITLVYGDILKQQFDFNNDTEYAAIVNAANEPMLGGGGIDGAISGKGGNTATSLLYLERMSVPENPPNVRCPTGEARLTNGYGFNGEDCKDTFNAENDKIKIIHTVGPDLHQGIYGTYNSSEKKHTPTMLGQTSLENCYKNCLLEADNRTLSTSDKFIARNLNTPNIFTSDKLSTFKKPITRIAFCGISTAIYGYPPEMACPAALQAVINYFKDHPQSAIKEVRFVCYSEEDYTVYKTEIATNFIGKLNQLDNPSADKLSLLRNSSKKDAAPYPPLVFTLIKGTPTT